MELVCDEIILLFHYLQNIYKSIDYSKSDIFFLRIVGRQWSVSCSHDSNYSYCSHEGWVRPDIQRIPKYREEKFRPKITDKFIKLPSLCSKKFQVKYETYYSMNFAPGEILFSPFFDTPNQDRAGATCLFQRKQNPSLLTSPSEQRKRKLRHGFPCRRKH